MSLSAEAILEILTCNHIEDFDTVWVILEPLTYNHILGSESNHR